mmetsp:Transcript_56126/g.62845  ORF Transcript_56126/g.62845 Transcript_56126/m.62845 type:complete len:115 (-) Transcript_56126:522-866(-)
MKLREIGTKCRLRINTRNKYKRTKQHGVVWCGVRYTHTACRGDSRVVSSSRSFVLRMVGTHRGSGGGSGSGRVEKGVVTVEVKVGGCPPSVVVMVVVVVVVLDDVILRRVCGYR